MRVVVRRGEVVCARGGALWARAVRGRRGAAARAGARGARRRAADAPRWWAATAAVRARRAPGRRGMSSAAARPGPRARHGAGRARAPPHPLLREEDLPQAHLLPPLLGPAVGPHRAGLRLRRYAHAPGARRYPHDQRYATLAGAWRARPAGSRAATTSQQPRAPLQPAAASASRQSPEHVGCHLVLSGSRCP